MQRKEAGLARWSARSATRGLSELLQAHGSFEQVRPVLPCRLPPHPLPAGRVVLPGARKALEDSRFTETIIKDSTAPDPGLRHSLGYGLSSILHIYGFSVEE